MEGILNTTRAAGTILAIDGCPVDCVRHCLEEAGFSGFRHLQFADLGLAKGQSPANAENVAKAVRAGRELLG